MLELNGRVRAKARVKLGLGARHRDDHVHKTCVKSKRATFLKPTKFSK